MRIASGRLYQAVDNTWPAKRFVHENGWILREGGGGGKRVSCATMAEPGAGITMMEAGMRALGQPPMVMIRDVDAGLDAELAARGYMVVDPVTIYAAEAGAITVPQGKTLAIPAARPLAVMEELWAQGGIGPGRRAVMARVTGPKAYILGRVSDSPAGAAFVDCDADIAMLHALHVAPEYRRHGLGRVILGTAARWAAENGAGLLALAVTDANLAANALYRSLGMHPVGHYHYRILPEV